MMIVTEESPDSSKKRKLRAEESDLLPLPKHFCMEQQQASLSDSSCPSSDIEFAECSYTMDNTKTSNETSSSASVTKASSYTSYSTGCSSSGYATTSSIEQCCSKGTDYKTQEYVEDLSFICPEFAVEDLQELMNPVGSYTLSSSRWSISSQDSEEEATTTIDKEFEEYFSTLMM
ncbi:hypothetical protein AALP_AA8G013800 [Arabis alpina]|uniref:Uncharacterized protein n=1 Tax=Arabis alpina TaxID=50452 RepID=A0A087G4A3_ARAAL|nr:hypothetical protein AALP_AA8G013800 [Arabis alpina]